MGSAGVLHEYLNGKPACGMPSAGTPTTPGGSTCQNANCRDLRNARKGAPPFTVAWPTPFSPAQVYAQKAYRALLDLSCPGGQGHEGAIQPGPVSAVYCDACLATAIAAAWGTGKDD